MTDEKKTTNAWRERFLVRERVLSTRSADAFRASLKQDGRPVLLWTLRHPLAHQDAKARFFSRIRSLSGLSTTPCSIIDFGVDDQGVAFAAIDLPEGEAIVPCPKLFDSTDIFTQCVSKVADLHRQDLVCGDISAASFWLSSEGEVLFIGIMGSFDIEAAATAVLPPLDTMYFISPEQRVGGALEPSSDVYSLGVLGYQLLTNRYPFASPFVAATTPLDAIPSVTSADPRLAKSWDEVLRHCLDPDPGNRISDAAELEEELKRRRQGIQTPKAAVIPVAVPVHTEHDAIPLEEAPKNISKKAAFTLVGLLFVSGVALFVVVQLAHMRKAAQVRKTLRSVTPHEPIPTVTQTPSPEPTLLAVTEASAVSTATASITATPSAVATVTAMATPALLAATSTPSTRPTSRPSASASTTAAVSPIASLSRPKIIPPLRIIPRKKPTATPTPDDTLVHADRVLLEHARFLGLNRTLEQLRQWVRSDNSLKAQRNYQQLNQRLVSPPNLGAFQRAVDDLITPKNPALSLRITTAYALDAGELQAVIPFIAATAKQIHPEISSEDLSAGGLILALPELSIFSEDAVQGRQQLKNRELVPLLRLLASRNDPNVRMLASEMVRRNMAPPLRKQFFEQARDRSNAPASLLAVLVHAGLGEIVNGEVESLWAWYGGSGEKLLLAICADHYPDEIKSATLELLSRRIATEPSSSLLRWLRDTNWENRARYAEAIGVLGSAELLPDEDVLKALQGLQRLDSSGEALQIVLHSRVPRLLKFVLERYPNFLNKDSLIALLDSSEREVRIAAIRNLASYRDVETLQRVREHYQNERDAEVLKVYREKFWMLSVQ